MGMPTDCAATDAKTANSQPTQPSQLQVEQKDYKGTHMAFTLVPGTRSPYTPAPGAVKSNQVAPTLQILLLFQQPMMNGQIPHTFHRPTAEKHLFQ